MSDLRFACIEAMAPVLHDFDDGRFCSDQCLVAAGSALDALLGVLEELDERVGGLSVREVLVALREGDPS